jgi:hypothetical protein
MIDHQPKSKKTAEILERTKNAISGPVLSIVLSNKGHVLSCVLSKTNVKSRDWTKRRTCPLCVLPIPYLRGQIPFSLEKGVLLNGVSKQSSSRSLREERYAAPASIPSPVNLAPAEATPCNPWPLLSRIGGKVGCPLSISYLPLKFPSQAGLHSDLRSRVFERRAANPGWFPPAASQGPIQEPYCFRASDPAASSTPTIGAGRPHRWWDPIHRTIITSPSSTPRNLRSTQCRS